MKLEQVRLARPNMQHQTVGTAHSLRRHRQTQGLGNLTQGAQILRFVLLLAGIATQVKT